MTSDDLAALHAAAFVQERPWTAAEFDTLIANPLTRIETVQHGFALWRAIAGEAELLTIAVAPAAQSEGVGAALMRAWMDKAALSCTEAFLEVAADNRPALRLYARYGFETKAKRAGYYRRSDTRADALILRAPLPFPVSKKSSGGLRP